MSDGDVKNLSAIYESSDELPADAKELWDGIGNLIDGKDASTILNVLLNMAIHVAEEIEVVDKLIPRMEFMIQNAKKSPSTGVN